MLTKKVSQQYIAKAKIPFIGITMEGKKIKLDSTLKIGDISCSTDRPKPNKYYPDYFSMVLLQVILLKSQKIK